MRDNGLQVEDQMARNKKWTSAIKFEIALLAIKGETPLSDICKRYEVAPSQVHAWKKQALEQGSQLFDKSDKAAVRAANNECMVSQLHEKIEQLTRERDYLKKSWNKFQDHYDKS